jgi:SulP family sulfate permease
MILYAIRQSNHFRLQQLRIDDERHLIDDEPPPELPADSVVMLEPVGSLFFAAAPAFEAMLPTVTDRSSNSVVVIRLRGRDNVGATLIDVFVRYAGALHDVESKLVLASVQPGVQDQLKATGMMDDLGQANVYGPGRWRTDTLLTAYDDATAWVANRRRPHQWVARTDDDHTS